MKRTREYRRCPRLSFKKREHLEEFPLPEEARVRVLKHLILPYEITGLVETATEACSAALLYRRQNHRKILPDHKRTQQIDLAHDRFLIVRSWVCS